MHGHCQQTHSNRELSIEARATSINHSRSTYEASVGTPRSRGESLSYPVLHAQRLPLPHQENELIIPRRVHLGAEREVEVPHHTRKCKARFEVGRISLAIRALAQGSHITTAA